ncbi:helix-turn-helix domain-containing protein [Membranihabitans marinus]|uniref:helix-turn-helix domain-containing protein n=1 Tax=Membranihabitans marinus TaxID=1227546 RepID=UPI001F17B0CB|nr:helix-turn-helix transcriptional regulator [Membranihabitans marinus]
MTSIYTIESVAHLHNLLEIEKPVHPLISVVRHSPSMRIDFGDVRFNSELYFISLKEDINGSFKYGRNSYDFGEGSMLFVSPRQVISSNGNTRVDEGGWSIFFHPDLIRKSNLRETISNYSFFNYDSYEALHLSDKEKKIMTECVNKIEIEINQNIDRHSQELIIHNIEAILKYGSRYYDRQFVTRTNYSKDRILEFDRFLKDYYQNKKQLELGIPTVDECGKAMNMSGKYLSDLLKAETGKSLIEHIHLHIVDIAKNDLLGTNITISQIAYSLGFEYPQHFSKVFKEKVGMSPSKYRSLN